MLTCTGSVLEVNFPQIDAQVSSMSFVWHFQESGTIHFWSIALGATQYWVLPRELNVNTCSCWIRFHCLRATYIRWPFKLHQISPPPDFLRWDFTQISGQNSADKSGDRCKIFVCPCGHCLSVSLTQRWWMTLVRTLHVFLQHSSPHKTLSTLVALGHSQEAVSLTERCWMTLSIYWGAQHNLAPAVPPQYTA